MRRWLSTARPDTWWEHKLLPVVSVFYATQVLVHASIFAHWLALAELLLAVVACAAYVSLINDATDRADDRVAGKRNALATASGLRIAGLLAVPVCVGAGMVVVWRHDPLVCLLYAGSWLAFTFYSVPPLRLKQRGAGGVLADAAGAHLFVALLAAAVAFHATRGRVNLSWMLAVGLWSLAFGIRGILWHQLSDRDGDLRAGVRTFALRHSPESVRSVVRVAIFPAEIIGLSGLVWQVRSPSVFGALAFYVAYVLVQRWRWHTQIVLVAWTPGLYLLMQECYVVFLPLALLIDLSLADPLALIVLLAHLLLFPRAPFATLHVLSALARGAAGKLA